MGMGIVCLFAVTDQIGKISDRQINSGIWDLRELRQVLDGFSFSKCAALWQLRYGTKVYNLV